LQLLNVTKINKKQQEATLRTKLLCTKAEVGRSVCTTVKFLQCKSDRTDIWMCEPLFPVD